MLSIRLPEKLEAKLTHLATMTKRTKSFYVREALECYLEDIEDLEDGYIAMERLRNPNAKRYTTEEAKRKLGI